MEETSTSTQLRLDIRIQIFERQDVGFELASKLRFSKRNNGQHYDLAPLDGRHKIGQVSTEPAISTALGEVAWYEQGSP